ISDNTGRDLLDDLVRASKNSSRDCETKRLCRLLIDKEFVFRWRLHWKIGRFFTLEDAIDVGRRAAKRIDAIWPVRDEAAFGDEEMIRIHGGQSVAGGKPGNQFAVTD